MTVYKPTYDGQNIAADKPSYWFDGNGDYVRCPASPAWQLGTSDSTMMVFGKLGSASSTKNIVELNTGSAFWAMEQTTANKLGSNKTGDNVTSSVDVTNSYATYALVRSSTTVKFYKNGILGQEVAQTPQDINATSRIDIGSTGTYSPTGNISRALLFNYAISEDKIRRYSSSSKLDYEDIGGSMTALVPTDDGLGKNQSTFESGYTNGATLTWWSKRANCTATVTNNAGGGQYGTYCAHIVADTTGWIYIYRSAASTVGKRYRISFYARKFITGGDFTGGMDPVGAGGNTNATNVTNPDLTTSFQYYSFDITATDVSGLAISTLNRNVPASSGIELDGISVIQLGAILDLEPESMTASIWHDESGNQLDGAVTGATLINAPHFSNTDYGPAAVKQELVDSSMAASYNFGVDGNYISTPSPGFGTSDLTFFTVVKHSAPATAQGQYYNGVAGGSLQFDLNATTQKVEIYAGGTASGGSNTALEVGKTYAIIATVGSSSKTYINGVLDKVGVSGTNSVVSSPLFVGAYSSSPTRSFLGQMYRNVIFNYILGEDRSRRYSAGAKLDYEDIGGSMTDKSLGLSWLNYSFNAFTPSGKAITSYTISATNQFGYLGSFPIVIGKKYRVTYSGFTGASSSVRLQFASGVFAGESDAQYLTSSAGYVDLTATVSDPSAVLLIQAGVSSGTGALTLVSIIQLGAVVDLEPENITDTTWFDTSGLHGVVSGALASRATPNYSSKNWLINGGFDFWQRNTSFSSSGYTADRFWIQFVSDTPTVSRVSDTSFGTPYALSIATTTGTTTGSVLRSPIESVTVRQMAGKFFTLSCYVKRNAGFNAGNIAFGVEWGTGNNEANPSGGYNLTKEVPYDFLNASTYVFVSHTFYVPATATSMSTFLGFYASSVNGTPPSGSQVIFKNMMLNEGPVAAPFERAGGSIGGELALCQRYYERSYDIDVATGAQNANGNVSCRVTSSGNTTTVSGSTFRVTKFKIPTVTIWSGSNSTPTSGKISLDGGSDAAGTAAASGIGTNGFIRVQGNTGLSDANTYLYGWTADAEI